MDFSIIIFVVLGVLPSLVWLFYYLSKDLHPEPKKMILKIFLWGCFITLPVFFIQMGLGKILDIIAANLGSPHIICATSYCLHPYLDYILGLSATELNLLSLGITLIYWFLAIACSEELFKYLVVRVKVFNNPNLDEPVDLMIYMVVAALGFAAVENILYLFTPVGSMPFSQLISRTLFIDFVRFIGATFLHTLCSAVIGYALAISFCDEKNRFLEAASGVVVAVVLHGLYNFSIMTLKGSVQFAIPVIIILTLAFLVFSGFEKLKKMKGICKIN